MEVQPTFSNLLWHWQPLPYIEKMAFWKLSTSSLTVNTQLRDKSFLCHNTNTPFWNRVPFSKLNSLRGVIKFLNVLIWSMPRQHKTLFAFSNLALRHWILSRFMILKRTFSKIYKCWLFEGGKVANKCRIACAATWKPENHKQPSSLYKNYLRESEK